jgi:hypothetical protein
MFGMGSFFRGDAEYEDVDLVLVIDFQSSDYVRVVRELHTKFEAIGGQIGERFDLTFLTPAEFALRPLRDMDTLVRVAI